MRSPLAPIQRWFSRVLSALQAGVMALEAMLRSMQALLEVLSRLESRESAQPLPPNDIRLEGRLESLAVRIDDLTLAVKEGVNNVQRSERRVRAIVSSARRELAEEGYSHAGLEAENSQLHEVDGEGGGGEGVPAVPEVLEQPDTDRASVIPGVSVRQMQLARARRR